MGTVVIIHALEDALPARALADKLRQANLTVVLERPFGADLRDALRDASTSVALWSPRAATSAEMIEDVAFARDRTRVIHATMQNTTLPEEFASDETANLTGWRGEDTFGPWRKLANLVSASAGAPPPPESAAASGFFQPPRSAAGQAPAEPRADARAPVDMDARDALAAETDYAPLEPRRAGGAGLIIGAIALAAVAVVGGGGYWLWQQQQSVHAAATAWDQIDRNDPTALRSFIASQSGPLKSQAESALSELEERSFEAASDTDSIEALQEFLQNFPDSEHGLAARGRIAELQASAGDEQTGETESLATTTATSTDLLPPGTTPQASGGTTEAPSQSQNQNSGPVTLTPPSEPSTSQEPPNAPTP